MRRDAPEIIPLISLLRPFPASQQADRLRHDRPFARRGPSAHLQSGRRIRATPFMKPI